MIAYKIDRFNSISVGQTLELCNDYIPNDAYPEFLTNNFVPGGLSNYGKHILNDLAASLSIPFTLDELSYAHGFVTTALVEYTYEIIRQARYPALPSRYQSVYAVKNISDFSVWPELTCSKYEIYKIEFNKQDSVYLDANFLKICLYQECQEARKFNYGFSPGNSWYYANQYWSGAISETPKMELLIKGPVKVLEKLNDVKT